VDLLSDGGSVGVWQEVRAGVRTLVVTRRTANGAKVWTTLIADAKDGTVSADRTSIFVGGKDRSSGHWRDRIWRFT